MIDPQSVAQKLLTEEGPHEAWQHATREAIDAHFRKDVIASAHWAAVQQHLSAIAPRPAAGDLDVYNSARSLISERGAQEAWRYAMQQAGEVGTDLRAQTYWLRVSDAVSDLLQTDRTWHL